MGRKLPAEFTFFSSTLGESKVRCNCLSNTCPHEQDKPGSVHIVQYLSYRNIVPMYHRH